MQGYAPWALIESPRWGFTLRLHTDEEKQNLGLSSTNTIKRRNRTYAYPLSTQQRGGIELMLILYQHNSIGCICFYRDSSYFPTPFGLQAEEKAPAGRPNQSPGCVALQGRPNPGSSKIILMERCRCDSQGDRSTATWSTYLSLGSPL